MFSEFHIQCVLMVTKPSRSKTAFVCTDVLYIAKDCGCKVDHIQTLCYPNTSADGIEVLFCQISKKSWL